MHLRGILAAFSSIPVILLIILLAFLSGSCKRSTEPIKIGFVGGLTGRLSSLGVAARNGATLAIEEINASGGLHGRKVEMLAADDHQDANVAPEALRKLHQDGVVAVVGPLTSSMAVSVVPVSNELQLVTVGPTVSTNELSEKDDYFFRPRPASKVLAQRIAYHMRIERYLQRISVIYDTNNRAHTESWYTHLKNNFEGYGGQVINTVTFSSADTNNFTELAQTITGAQPDAVFILASSIDTGLIAQQLRKQGARQPLFASEWSFTNDLLQFGGKAVENLTICHTYNLLDGATRFTSFKTNFIERFNETPSFAAGHSYDATRLILAALQFNPDPARLKQSLLDMPGFPGLQAHIKFNRFGDTDRKTFLTTIKNGSFALLE